MPRFVTPRDFDFFQHINREIVVDVVDVVVVVVVDVVVVPPGDTTTLPTLVEFKLSTYEYVPYSVKLNENDSLGNKRPESNNEPVRTFTWLIVWLRESTFSIHDTRALRSTTMLDVLGH